MGPDDAIIAPFKGKNSPNPGLMTVMVGADKDLFDVCRTMEIDMDSSCRLFTSRLYLSAGNSPPVSVAGPMIGAPYAVMVMETLIAWGVKEILYFGWCGAISPDVRIGDIIVPTSAVIDEGTSRHYMERDGLTAHPSPSLVKKTEETLRIRGLSFHSGAIWTTDAIFRETRDKVRRRRHDGALAVEMEASAIFTVAKFRRIDAGALLVVSDEVSESKWIPGFSNESFKASRKAICRVIDSICRKR